MRNSTSGRGSVNAAAKVRTSYNQSKTIRQWLALVALASTAVNDDMQQALALAFEKARQGLIKDEIWLDYEPLDPKLLDIPPIDHPHYMQALLYWSVRLDCSLEVLAETHAFLGSSPTIAAAFKTARHLEQEEVVTKNWVGSAKRRKVGDQTVPLFYETNFPASGD